MSESRATVAQNAVSGVAWNVVISLAARVVGVASTLFVTRFISPGDYGEVMGAAIVANSCLALSQLGLAQYIVARPSVGPSETFHATFYGTTVCVLLLVVALAAETHLAPYFRVQELPHYLPWMALVVLMDRVVTIPERLLYRDMRFRTAALNRATGEIVYAVLAVGLVAAGAGGMGLVVAGLARSLLRAVVIVAMVHWRRWAEPCRLTWVTTTELFGYGLPLSAGNIAGFISTRWDNLITARFFGAGTMGAYNLAYSLAEMPNAQVAEQVGDVLLPLFAKLPPVDRRRALARTLPLLGLIIFPMAIGLGAVADTLVKVFFDARWGGVSPMLAVLAALSISRPVSYAVVSYLQAECRVGVVSVLEVGKVILLFVAMIVAAPHGVMALCVAVGLAFGAHAVCGVWVVSGAEAPFLSMMGRVSRPLLATVPMAAAVLTVRAGLHHVGGQPAWLGLIAELAAGAAIYVAAAWVLARPVSNEFIGLARGVLARRHVR